MAGEEGIPTWIWLPFVVVIFGVIVIEVMRKLGIGRITLDDEDDYVNTADKPAETKAEAPAPAASATGQQKGTMPKGYKTPNSSDEVSKRHKPKGGQGVKLATKVTVGGIILTAIVAILWQQGMITPASAQTAQAGTGTIAGFDITTIGYIVVGIIASYVLVLRGIFMVKDDEVGVLTKMFGGRSMPQGQIIARRGEVGIQANTLMPGLYWRFPIFWKVKKVDVTVINPGQIGLVESIDGEPIAKGRLLADEVSCNYFQDAVAFLDNHGKKGWQIQVLPPGTYRINTEIFKVTVEKATKIESEKTGIVTAQDGLALSKDYLIAPQPLVQPTDDYPKARAHKYFQDGQAFIDSKGYRGTQLDTLQPGEYYLNTKLFSVQAIDIAEVPPGFVAVLRSNVGAQSQQEPLVDKTDSPTNLEAQAETLLIEDRNTRGIWKTPLPPGKYNLNLIAYTPFYVPTSAVTIDWATGTDNRVSSGEAFPFEEEFKKNKAAQNRGDVSDASYISKSIQDKARAFFRFSQLRVTSKDGFQLDVDIRMVMRILPSEAAWVTARFGTVENLIEQIVHPLIDSSFRNKAGEKKAIDFIQSRTELQANALEHAKHEFERHHVQAQDLLIAYIKVDDALLKTQTDKEIAIQKQTQFEQEAKAEEKRIDVEEKRSRANKQAEVVAAQLQIEINKNRAKAAVEEAMGQRDSIKAKADGDAEAIRKIGQATADAYGASAQVIGPENVTLVNVMKEVKEGKVKIVPDTFVTSGGDGNGLANAFFASFVANGKGRKKDDSDGVDGDKSAEKKKEQ